MTVPVQSLNESTVSMICLHCGAGRSVDMKLFWKRGSDNRRFCSVQCVGAICTTSWLSIEKWLRHPKQPHNTVLAWLTFNAAVDSLKCPDLLTADSYNSQIVSLQDAQDSQDSEVSVFCPECHEEKSGYELILATT